MSKATTTKTTTTTTTKQRKDKSVPAPAPSQKKAPYVGIYYWSDKNSQERENLQTLNSHINKGETRVTFLQKKCDTPNQLVIFDTQTKQPVCSNGLQFLARDPTGKKFPWRSPAAASSSSSAASHIIDYMVFFLVLLAVCMLSMVYLEYVGVIKDLDTFIPLSPVLHALKL